MSIVFDNANTKIEHTTASGFDNANLSLLAWIFLTSFGEAAAGGYIVGFPEAGSTYRIASTNQGSSNTLEFVYTWSTGGSWRAPNNALTTGRWFCVAATYDRGATTNDPLLYILDTNSSSTLVSQTVSRVVAPTGTATTPATGWIIGNNTTQTRTFDGRIAHVHAWNRILTIGELNHAARHPGRITNGLKLYCPLYKDGTDLSGNVQNGTSTSTAVGDGPPAGPLNFGFGGWEGSFTAAAAATKAKPPYRQGWTTWKRR